MLTLITPTGDRPEGLDRCCLWMTRQTFTGPVQWVVVDDGETPYMPPFGRPGWTVRHVTREDGSAPSVQSFVGNLLTGTALTEGDKVLIIEDDDYYAPTHLEEIARRLDDADATGDGWQHYYHLPTRQWCQMKNKGSCLCQTGFRRDLLGEFEDAAKQALRKNSRGVDAMFWTMINQPHLAYDIDIYREPTTVVGIKGLAGRPGLGLGHRPETTRGLNWQHDPDGSQLREWLGDDAEFFVRASCDHPESH